MWQTDTRWFDVAIVMSILSVGGVLFGRFEQHKPRWRRLVKQPLVLGLYLLFAGTLGRAWGYGFLAFFGLLALVVHAWWLPRNGINGWTAEPYDKYLALITGKKSGSA